MAEQPNPNPQPQQAEEREVVVDQQEPRSGPKLRYLDFVQVAAAQAAVYLAGLYGLAKDHAGPLRPGVDAVESTVKGVVGPVYARFGGLPLDVLAFVDCKISRKNKSRSWVLTKNPRPSTPTIKISRKNRSRSRELIQNSRPLTPTTKVSPMGRFALHPAA